MPRGSNTPPGPLTRAISAILSDAFPDLLITQTELGRIVGMSQSAVSRAFLGELVLDVEQLARVCKALGLRASDVMRFAEDQITK